jgi:type I restriction enzyme S subunit
MKASLKPGWSEQQLGNLVSFKTGKLNSNAATADGPYPFFTCSRDTFRTDTFSFDTEAVLLAGNNANGVFPIKYFAGKFDAYQRTYVIETCNNERLLNRFLFYALRMKLDLMQTLSTGVATKFLTLTILNNLVLNLPPLSDQRSIASILSAYDDLIENNTRRIAILEEMARRLYQEWFVHFRFPGHQKVKMVESELGPIPEGWEVKPVSDIVHINPKTKLPKEGEKPFIPMANLSETSMLIDGIEHKAGNSGAKFRNGDTLFARITPCLENGKTGYVNVLPNDETVGFGSTEFVVMRSNTVCPEYVYLLARSDNLREHAIKSMSGATGRQRVRYECFNNFFLPEPDQGVIGKFRTIAAPMFQMIHTLALKNANLRTQRDLLLPKLISGEIDVSKLEKNPQESKAA